MGYIALMLANYFHDLAVAMLAANVVVIHVAGRYLEQNPTRRDFLAVLVKKMTNLTWWVLGYVVLAGGVRAYFFMEYEWNPLVPEQGMLVALGVKHILLFGLTGFGILGMRKVRSQYGEQD